MDNVFFLRDLPPSAAAAAAAAAAADPALYLLSVTSCETTLTSLDTPDGVLELDPITVSIHAVPSTFLFAFENHAANTPGDNAVFVNPRKASVELDVHFDFFVALDRLEGMVKDNVALRDELGENDETLSHETLSHETPPLAFKGTEEKCQATGEQIYEGHHHHHHPTTQYHDQLLHVLHELVEKESRQLDWMLVGLGFVFILLMLHYARTVSPLIRSSKQSLKKREKATSVVDPSPATSRAYDVETKVKGAFVFHLACHTKSCRNPLSYSWLFFSYTVI
jgi:Na+-transporting methylmalonyl-CoA/oxaloacetate decarboxylase gamma subunit